MANSILAKMAVQITANNAEFNKAMQGSSMTLTKFAEQSDLSSTKVGQLASKLSSFVNPVTATIAVVGGLSAAYARSTIGAKDLEFAQNQLAAATTLLTNEFASLFSSAEDGEGALTKLMNSMMNALGPAGIALSTTSKAMAMANEAIEDLGRNEIIARTQADELLADNIEKMTTLKESQIEYSEKIHQTTEMLTNVNNAEDGILKSLNAQLEAKRIQLNTDKENEKLKDEELLLELEISKETKKYERLRQQILRLESDITDQYRKQKKEIFGIDSLSRKRADEAMQIKQPKTSLIGVIAPPIDIKALKASADAAVAQYNRLPETFIEVEEKMMNITGLIVGGISDIAEAFGQATVEGPKNFGQSFIRSLATFAQQFGGLLIATGLGEIALRSGNPALMIAGGVALIAAGAAVKALVKPSLSGSSSVGSVGQSFPYRPTVNEGFQNFTLTTQISGTDLNIIAANTNNRNRFTRP